MTEVGFRLSKKRRFASVMGIAIRIPVLSLIAVASIYAGWHFFYPSYSWHQKLTIEIDTPQGIVSGSAVSEVTWGDSPNILPDSPHVYHDFTGEAVVVELPGNDGEGREKQYLFVLGKNTAFEALHVFAPNMLPKIAPYSTNDLLVVAKEVVRHQGESRPVPEVVYPLMVTFNDINDPASVKSVEPHNLEAAFGPGYRLSSITMTITDDPVTVGRVEAALGWISKANFIIPPEQQPRYVDDQTIEQKLMPSDFIDWRTLKSIREEGKY